MSMSDINNNNKIISCLLVIIFMLGLIIGLLWGISWEASHENLIKSEQFGGAVPMNIYTVYDRDTGVYYAVTEKGGICVMYTMDGQVKLVDEGNNTIRHPNQG